ncbi:hypothetical protein JCM11491_002023 [Sporobolomyces phaffii]
MDKHKILGFVLLGLVILQGLLGLWAHWAQKLKQENARGDEIVEEKRRVSNWLHIGIGIGILSLGGLQVTWGLGEFDRLVSHVPAWITVIHFIIAGIPVLIVTPFVLVRGALRMRNGQSFAQAFFDRPATPRHYVPPRKLFLGSSSYRSVEQDEEKDGEQEGLIGAGHGKGKGETGQIENEPEWVGATTREEYEASLTQTQSRTSTQGTVTSDGTVLFDAASEDKASISPSPAPLASAPSHAIAPPSAHSPSIYPPTPATSTPFINPEFPTSTMSPVSLPIFSPPPPPAISPRLAFMPFAGSTAVNHHRAPSSATQPTSTPSSTPQLSTLPSIRSGLSDTYERHVIVVPSPSPPPIPPRPVSLSTSAASNCGGDSARSTSTPEGVAPAQGISRHASMTGEIVGAPKDASEGQRASLEATLEEDEPGVNLRVDADEGEQDEEEIDVVGDDESTRLMDELERELSISSTRSRRIPDGLEVENEEAEPSQREAGVGDTYSARDQSGKWLGGSKE